MSETESKPILCVAFDGVIHLYSKGWQDGTIYDRVVPGFFEWMEKASKLFRLVVYSSRSRSKEGRSAMMRWLWSQMVAHYGKDRSHNLFPAIEFAHEKLHAFLIIDDRGMQFRGDWSAWWLQPERLCEFKPWNAGGQVDCEAVSVRDDMIAALRAASKAFANCRSLDCDLDETLAAIAKVNAVLARVDKA